MSNQHQFNTLSTRIATRLCKKTQGTRRESRSSRHGMTTKNPLRAGFCPRSRCENVAELKNKPRFFVSSTVSLLNVEQGEGILHRVCICMRSKMAGSNPCHIVYFFSIAWNIVPTLAMSLTIHLNLKATYQLDKILNINYLLVHTILLGEFCHLH